MDQLAALEDTTTPGKCRVSTFTGQFVNCSRLLALGTRPRLPSVGRPLGFLPLISVSVVKQGNLSQSVPNVCGPLRRGVSKVLRFPAKYGRYLAVVAIAEDEQSNPFTGRAAPEELVK